MVAAAAAAAEPPADSHAWDQPRPPRLVSPIHSSAAAPTQPTPRFACTIPAASMIVSDDGILIYPPAIRERAAMTHHRFQIRQVHRDGLPITPDQHTLQRLPFPRIDLLMRHIRRHEDKITFPCLSHKLSASISVSLTRSLPLSACR
jgi:hypothetical protein